VPSNMVVMALSLVVTIFVMGPVLKESLTNISKENVNFDTAPGVKDIAVLSTALTPWSDFIKKHAGKEEVKSLTALKIAREKISTQVEVPFGPVESDKPLEPDMTVLLASFMITELKEAFSMGFVLLLPFLVIDLIVSNLLVGMGMFMVSPAMITLPLKLMLFIVCDGWMLLTKGLVMSYV